jgi:hypothetical protein
MKGKWDKVGKRETNSLDIRGSSAIIGNSQFIILDYYPKLQNNLTYSIFHLMGCLGPSPA